MDRRHKIAAVLVACMQLGLLGAEDTTSRDIWLQALPLLFAQLLHHIRSDDENFATKIAMIYHQEGCAAAADFLKSLYGDV